MFRPVLALILIALLAKERGYLPGTFTRVYRGTINELPVRMTLTRKQDRLTGSYEYVRVGKPLAIQGSLNAEEGFTLDEFDDAGKKTGSFNGDFRTPNRMEGSWSKPGSEKELYFFAEEAVAPDGLQGTWGWDAKGATFSIELVRRGGNRIEGCYDALTRNAARVDASSPIVGTVRGNVATVRFTSAYSATDGEARITLKEKTLHWKMTREPTGECWAPREATLKRHRPSD
jgi:hypothetical protein